MQDLLKVLSDWRQQSNNTITSALTQIDNSKHFREQDLDWALQAITTFHRDINKADEKIVDIKWYGLCIRNKKKLKKMVQNVEKMKKSKKYYYEIKEKKEIAPVKYPQELTKGRGAQDEKILKYMFKSFVTNFEEAQAEPKVVSFLQETLKAIKFKFEDNTDDSLNKRVISICTRLAKENSKEAKTKMIKGLITPKQVSSDDEELYFDEKTRENIKKIQKEEVERNAGGFYENMKKQINKDASEKCRFCNKNSAYCEDQKQIRASDQPMTRFMRCNDCEKTWRD